MNLIAFRAHTTFEIEKKLLKRGFKQSTVRGVVSKCLDLQLVNDKDSGRIYLQELVRKGYGPHRIRRAMAQKGLSRQLVDELFSEETVEENEKSVCERVLIKKMNHIDTRKNTKNVKAFLYRFLLTRGFSAAVIVQLLEKNIVEE